MSAKGAEPNQAAKVGRNDPCPCGSGKKFKHCCERKSVQTASPDLMDRGPSPPRPAKQVPQSLLDAAKQHANAGRWSDAILRFQEIVRLDPRNPQAHCDLGVTYLRCGRTREASASLQRAVDLRPSFESALNYLVAALEAQGARAEAALACRRLSRVAEDPAIRRYYSARGLTFEDEPEEAEKELRRLLLLAPAHAPARHLLGKLLADRGMFEEAAGHLSEIVEVVPNAFQLLTAVKRMTESDRPLLDRVRVIVGRPDLDLMQRVSIHFGLGKAFDDLRDYAEAMRHFDEANRLRAASTRLNREALAARFDHMIARFSAEALAREGARLAPPARPGDEAPVFIVGMPRSGTTLVEQILSSHPDVAAGGELNFWRQRHRGSPALQVDLLDAGALNQAAEDYSALLRKIGPGALRVTDKNPMNFELLWLIRLALPRARIIHCRRRPVDTCLSIFFKNFSSRHDYAWDRGDLVFYYRHYERLIGHWRDVLPADCFTEVDYETLVANQEAETRRLVAFCGLDWDDACLSPERNDRAVDTASRWQIRQRVYRTSVERWRRYEPWLGELRELLPAETT